MILVRLRKVGEKTKPAVQPAKPAELNRFPQAGEVVRRPGSHHATHYVKSAYCDSLRICQENGLVNGTRGFVASLENNENADLGPTGIYPLVRFAGCKGTTDRLITSDKFRFKEKARATEGK